MDKQDISVLPEAAENPSSKSESLKNGRFSEAVRALACEELDRAEELLLACAEGATNDDARRMADAISRLASMHRRNKVEFSGKNTKIESLLALAIELRRNFLEKNDESLAVELSNLALHHQIEDEIDRAIELFEESVKILDSQVLCKADNLSHPYDNFAALLFERKNYTRAEQLCRASLEIRDRSLGETNPLSLMSVKLLFDIQEAAKPHCRAARETRKEFRERLDALKRSKISKENSSLNLLCQILDYADPIEDVEIIYQGLSLVAAYFTVTRDTGLPLDD